MTVKEIEKEMELKEIKKHINILTGAIQRENRKHYFKEENRQKKIKEINIKLEFWYNRLANISE